MESIAPVNVLILLMQNVFLKLESEKIILDMENVLGIIRTEEEEKDILIISIGFGKEKFITEIRIPANIVSKYFLEKSWLLIIKSLGLNTQNFDIKYLTDKLFVGHVIISLTLK